MRQRNRIEPTRAVCYRSKTPLDQDFLSLIFFFFFNFPNFILGVVKIIDQEREEKERKRKNGWLPSVGNQSQSKPPLTKSFLPFLSFITSKFPSFFLDLGRLLKRKKERRELQVSSWFSLDWWGIDKNH